MHLYTCSYCGNEIDLDVQDTGAPVLVPDVGNMTVVQCDICGQLLTVKVESDHDDRSQMNLARET